MSHFAVLVIGDDVEKQLAPYQENNMGDCPKEYMEFTDKEDEIVERYNTGTEEKDGKQVPYKEIYKTLQEFVSDYYGYSGRDEEKNRYGSWENPNRKWDWWQIGGRYRGRLLLKKKTTPEDFLKDNLSMSGEKFEELYKAFLANEDETMKVLAELYPPYEKYIKECFGYKQRGELIPIEGDSAYKKDIDMEGMIKGSVDRAAKLYDKTAGFFGGTIPKLDHKWEDLIKDESLTRDQAEAMYKAQPAIKLFRELIDKKVITFHDEIIHTGLEKFQLSREEYLAIAAKKYISAYAVLKDGKWYEQGKMGWWGMSSDEMSDEEWAAKIAELIADISDDTLLTIVDCHI